MSFKTMTDHEALGRRKSLPEKKARAKAIAKEIRELTKEIKEIQDDMRGDEWIRVHKGRPYLRPWEHDYENLEETRRATISKRAVDEFFNVQLDGQKPYGFDSTHYGNVAFRLQVTEPEAKRVALAWVLDGEQP